MPTTARDIAYSDGDTPLAGLLVGDDDETAGPRPGILLVHGGGGLDAHARGQAERYAALGYDVFACDMYGPIPPGDGRRAMLMALRDNPDTLVRRAQAGLTVLADEGNVDGRFGAVGFCFGGMTVITPEIEGFRQPVIAKMPILFEAKWGKGLWEAVLSA